VFRLHAFQGVGPLKPRDRAAFVYCSLCSRTYVKSYERPADADSKPLSSGPKPLSSGRCRRAAVIGEFPVGAQSFMDDRTYSVRGFARRG
jgi:hypothetical protein